MNPKPPIPEDLWAKIPPDVQDALLATFRVMQDRIDDLEAKLRDLQARLQRDSTNSHKPPASDPPHFKRPPPKKPSGKFQGGQPGHKRHLREMVPPERVDQTVEVLPCACRQCGGALQGADPDPRRHQVAEIPPIEPTIVEYRIHCLECPQCGTTTCGTLPEGVPAGAFGPKLQALLCLLVGAYRLSKRSVQGLARDAFGLHISTGAICKLERQGSEALAAAHAEARAAVKAAPAAHVDETGWREGGERAWLWVAATEGATAFLIRPSRGAEPLAELVGESPAMPVVSDRYPTYRRLRLRQLCWAHLRRDFQAMIDRGGGGAATGEALLSHSDRVFDWWRAFKEGKLARSSLRTYGSRLRCVVRDVLEAGTRCGDKVTERTCRSLLRDEPHLWTFASREGVCPDNNAAERALRHAVMLRKTSGGTASAGGSRFVERILTVVETCRLRGVKVLDFLTRSFASRRQGMAGPSLLS